MRVTTHSAEHVSGTSAEIAQREIIRDNLITWRRERRRRGQVVAYIERKPLNSIGTAMVGKRVFV